MDSWNGGDSWDSEPRLELSTDKYSELPTGYQPIQWGGLPGPVASLLRIVIQGKPYLQRTRVQGLAWLVQPVPANDILILWDGIQAERVERTVTGGSNLRKPFLFRQFPKDDQHHQHRTRSGSTHGSGTSGTLDADDEANSGPNRWGGGSSNLPPQRNVTVFIYEPANTLQLDRPPILTGRVPYQLKAGEDWFDVAQMLFGLPFINPLIEANRTPHSPFRKRYDYDRPPLPNSTIQVPGYQLPISGSAAWGGSLRFIWQGPTEGRIDLPLQPEGSSQFWEHRLPIKAGDYLLTARNGQAEHKRNLHIEPAQTLRSLPLSLCYLPERGELLLVTDYLEYLIDEDSRLIDDALTALNQAVESGDAQAIAEKKTEVMKTLAPPGTGQGGIAGITELVGYKGRKYTYVRSDKIANHRRRYNLTATVRDERRFTRSDGTFDPDKAQRTLTRDYSKGIENVDFKLDLFRFDAAMTDWAENWNEETGKKRDWLADSEDYSVTTEAAVMRLVAGASLSAKISKTTLSLSGEASASAVLGEGKVTLESHFPTKDGIGFAIKLKNKVTSRDYSDILLNPNTDSSGHFTLLDFGALRASLFVELLGFAGAKALFCANVELSMSGMQAELKGLTDREAQQKAESDPDFKPNPPVQGGDGALGAFAGISGGCALKGALEWDNPEKRVDDNPAFVALAEIGGELNAQIGGGAEAKLFIGFERGKYMVRARVGACLGVGAAGQLVCAVGVNNILDFIQCIYHQLMKCDFRKLTFMSERAFEAFHQVISGALQLGEQVFDCLQDTVRDISEWWKALELTTEHDEQAKQLAENILKDEHGLVQFAPPEAKASVLRKLCKVEGTVGNWSLTGFNELREEAVIKVLSTVTCERELVEIVERMGPDGPVHPSKTDWDSWRGFELLTEILDGREQRLFTRWYEQLPKTAAKDVRADVAAAMAQSTVRLA